MATATLSATNAYNVVDTGKMKVTSTLTFDYIPDADQEPIDESVTNYISDLTVRRPFPLFKNPDGAFFSFDGGKVVETTCTIDGKELPVEVDLTENNVVIWTFPKAPIRKPIVLTYVIAHPGILVNETSTQAIASGAAVDVVTE